MSGERTDSLHRLVARAGVRVARLQGLVQEMYVSGADQITQQEVDHEMKTYGHFYDPNCQSPFCIKARALYQKALVMQQQATDRAMQEQFNRAANPTVPTRPLRG